MYRKCDTKESTIGIHRYLCNVDGTGGVLKTVPEDFVVKEISNPPDRKNDGAYTIASITSRNWETNRLVRLMSRSLKISRERIGFAGTKDKRAVTTQLMSFKCPPDVLRGINLKDVYISNMYRGDRAISIGDLTGNSFEINVRNCKTSKDDTFRIINEDLRIINNTGGFPNYFGVQRFGSIRPVTHLVGEKLVKGDIEGAVRTYISFTTPEEDKSISDKRRELEGCTDWKPYLNDIPIQMSTEKMMMTVLANNGDDWIGAINILPKNLQMMFIHAYQSYLFNEMLSRRMDIGIPLDAPVEGDIIIPMDSSGVPQHDSHILTTSRNIDLVTRQVRLGRAFITIVLFGSESGFAGGEMGEIERNVIKENKL